jgi:hypothetical protein
VLADLGLKIQVNKTMEVLGMVRIRNDYGGFWGSGVSFDIRQLTVRGLIGNSVRYYLGDINYKMTPFTLWNNDQEWSASAPQIFKDQMGVVNYDHFYNFNNAWRQQGAAADGGFLFSKGLQELKWNVFSSRVKTTDFANTPDRIFTGIGLNCKVNNSLNLGWNYANLWDVNGTANVNTALRNPVNTATLNYQQKVGRLTHVVHVEVGISKRYMLNDDQYIKKSGRFVQMSWKESLDEGKWNVEGVVSRVESGFRSPGAQTRRINTDGALTAYQRLGNDQSLRSLNMLDLMRESNLYNMQLQTELMGYLPYYDNITPYGAATPNRQGFQIIESGNLKDGQWNWNVSQMWMKETKGEGTATPRRFQRIKAQLTGKVWQSGKSNVAVQLEARQDHTKRQLQEGLPQTDLKTQAAVIGVDIAWNEKWHTLLGSQFVQYNGTEVASIYNYTGDIVNYNEQTWKGKEWMNGVGMKYVFSEKSFLTLQTNMWSGNSDNWLTPQYKWKQMMILYQMNF